jgi:Protein of unknown function (DUF1266)
MFVEEKWARGAYSLWTGGEDCATWTAARAKKALDDWYGATDGDETLETIHELCDGEPEDAAWDMVRAIDLLRIALAAQYIDATQCRTEIATIGKALQAKYAGWEELAKAFEAGMHAWQKSSGVTDPKPLGRVQRNLPVLRAEIWPACDFKSALGV